MKKINVFSLAATFAGSFLGAGYVSGRELLQFFGGHGAAGFRGLALAIILQFLFGAVLLLLARRTGIHQADKLVIAPELPWLRGLFTAVLEIQMFIICVSMLAAFGAMLQQLTELPAFFGAFVLALVVAVLAMLGLRGAVAVFSLSVPLLVGAALILSIVTLCRQPMQIPAGSGNGWGLSALIFLSYNLLGSIGILAPLGGFLKGKKQVWTGIALGCVALAVIAVGILLSIFAVPASREAELPMLTIAMGISPVAAAIYAILLGSAMLGTSLSCMVALEIFAGQRMPRFKKYQKPLILAVTALALAGSTFGFSRIIEQVYPIVGYIGFGVLIGLLIHCCMAFRKKAPAAP